MRILLFFALVLSFSVKGQSSNDPLCDTPEEIICADRSSAYEGTTGDESFAKLAALISQKTTGPNYVSACKEFGPTLLDKDAFINSRFNEMRALLTQFVEASPKDSRAAIQARIEDLNVGRPVLFGELLSSVSESDLKVNLRERVLSICGVDARGDNAGADDPKNVVFCPFYYSLAPDDPQTLWVSVTIAHELGHFLADQAIKNFDGPIKNWYLYLPSPELTRFIKNLKRANIVFLPRYEEEVSADYWMARVIIRLLEKRELTVEQMRSAFAYALKPYCGYKENMAHPGPKLRLRFIFQNPDVRTKLECK